MRRCVAALLPLLATGCSQSGAPIEFVLPAGFSGPVWIGEDAKEGKPIPKEGGRYRVEVPPSGVLRVSSTQPFQQWHSESARYTDATALLHDRGDGIPDDVVALRGGGYTVSSRGGRSVAYLPYYVGTKAQAQKFLETPDPPPE